MAANQYGYFSADNREFIITDPRTPRPWFNYMWNEHYAGLISHTGGGFSFIDSPRDNRINRMRYNCLPWDRPGRYVMVKDTETGHYWSLSWAPTLELDYDRYECRHGQGYTRITTEIHEIRGEITYFVPTDTSAEIWSVKLDNLSDRPRTLEIYSFTELLMGNALNDLINQPNDKHFTDIHFDGDRQTLIATRRYWVLNKKVSVAQPNLSWGNKVYFTQTLPITGFDGSLDQFIGRWRSEANPIAIETGQMGNSEITAGDPVAALQSSLNLAAGDSQSFAVILAVAPKDIEDPYPHLHWDSLASLEGINDRFEQLRQKWDRQLSALSADTPDHDFNTMINVWNPYQASVTFDMARNSGYYHGGLLFGTGLRDQFQDILAVVMADPARVRSRLLNALRYQFCDGSTLHNFFKLTDTGEKTNHSDTPLWIPFGIVEYLNETGDFSILDEVVEYHDELADPEDSQGSVYEHMVRALDYAISNLSDRHLPKIRNGDWNDTLDHVGPHGRGETIWGAFFLGYALQKTFPLLELRSDSKTLSRFHTAYEKLRKATNEFCWDGNWYLRAFRDNGSPIGIAAHPQGKIFLNAQSWAVISGLATAERGDRALASCREHLATQYGMQICWPAYTEVDDTIGLISRCVPGKKENGAIFNHASSWFVLASLINGDVEFAYDIYCRMMPLRESRDRDRFEVEPYVYPEYVTSPEHPTHGQGSHTWLTGTAVWMYRIGVDYILGFRTTLTGITIDPHIPAAWSGFQATRQFRGKTIHLKVSNSDSVNQGVIEMTINGIEQPSSEIVIEDWEMEQLSVVVRLGEQ